MQRTGSRERCVQFEITGDLLAEDADQERNRRSVIVDGRYGRAIQEIRELYNTGLG